MDRKISSLLRKETQRQEENIELIASENYVSKDILKLQGSILTNKYAENDNVKISIENVAYDGKNLILKLKTGQLYINLSGLPL